jgi:hypothetical protein
MIGVGGVALLLALWCAPIDSDTRPARAVWVLNGEVVAELHELSEGVLDKSGPGGALLFGDGGERLDCPEVP